MQELTLEQREAVMNLATRYNAFRQSQDARDWSGVIVWGKLLQECQATTGVYVVEPYALASYIRDAYKASEAA